MPLGPGPKKNFKDEEGAVITGPKNITTIPIKFGKVGKNVMIGEKIPYIEDDYNIKKKLAKKEMEYHHSMVQEKPFSQKAKHTDMFNTFRQVYEENPMIPARKAPVEPELPEGAEKPEELHNKPFRPSHPSKKGAIKGALEKFPAYLPDPPV
jgi:ribosomal protein L14E/L6E/L27E